MFISKIPIGQLEQRLKLKRPLGLERQYKPQKNVPQYKNNVGDGRPERYRVRRELIQANIIVNNDGRVEANDQQDSQRDQMTLIGLVNEKKR